MGTDLEGAYAHCASHLAKLAPVTASGQAVDLDPITASLQQRLAQARSPDEAWRIGSAVLLEARAPFELHAELYACLARNVENGLLPAWAPDPAQPSNLSRLMNGLGFGGYSELHAWSVAEPEAYWRACIDALDLRFEVPPQRMRGAPNDVEAPRWLEGARLNVARACLEGAPESPALIVRRQGAPASYSKRELTAAVTGAAAGLRRLGIGPGASVAIAVPLGFDAVVAYLALLYVGASAVCIAESYSEQEIDVRLQITKPTWVITADVVRRSGKALPLYDKFTRVNAPRAIVVAEGEVQLRPGDITWGSITAEPHDAVPLAAHPTPVEVTNTVLFSSGTTGSPKAIPWTPACALKAAADARWHLDVRSGDRLAWPTSLGWMMGAWSIFATLLNDATLVVFDDAPTRREFGQFVAAQQVTHLGVVPSLVRAWRAERTLEGLDLTKIRVFSSTGECSNPGDMLYLMWLAHYRPIVEYCGGTEIAGGYITSTVLHPSVPSCFTTAALGQTFVVLGESGEPVTEGEAFLTTPSVGLSTTLLNRDHHDEYFAGAPRLGLRRHGDLIAQVSAQYFRVLGRADDTMNLGGVKVSSAEIERACQDAPNVHELAAIALSPPGGGPSALVMCVVAKSEHAIESAELLTALQSRVRERVNPLFKVERVVLLDALPRTASNKVMRRLLRSRYADLLAQNAGAAERTVR